MSFKCCWGYVYKTIGPSVFTRRHSSSRLCPTFRQTHWSQCVAFEWSALLLRYLGSIFPFADCHDCGFVVPSVRPVEYWESALKKATTDSFDIILNSSFIIILPSDTTNPEELRMPCYVVIYNVFMFAHQVLSSRRFAVATHVRRFSLSSVTLSLDCLMMDASAAKTK
jgi:hypothetical protein